ncbi:hypothetical protein PsYK624_155220 [Phanerochaete sordida]|uniref:Uncharacterized protein n=1 Tax=Phanerochaete sordida TaxID=48140 RepID=A0A9P3GRZ1_9APHY|nr:hypothetical protein PsYK624_155220 [Phanerochaete sordida]
MAAQRDVCGARDLYMRGHAQARRDDRAEQKCAHAHGAQGMAGVSGLTTAPASVRTITLRHVASSRVGYPAYRRVRRSFTDVDVVWTDTKATKLQSRGTFWNLTQLFL